MNPGRIVYLVALIILVIGGINWGLVGIFNFDLVAFLFGTMSGFSRLVYIFVGLSALVVAIFTFLLHSAEDLKR